MKRYAKKEIVRRYYKYVESPWTQPKLSGNTSNSEMLLDGGTNSYKLFDGDGGTVLDTSTDKDIIITFDKSHSLNKMTVYATYSGTIWANPRKISISSYDSSTDTWTEIGSVTSESSGNYTVSTDLITNKATVYKVHITGYTYIYGSRVNSITLTGTQYVAQPSTIDDYDFYKDVDGYKAPKIDDKYFASTQGV